MLDVVRISDKRHTTTFLEVKLSS